MLSSSSFRWIYSILLRTWTFLVPAFLGSFLLSALSASSYYSEFSYYSSAEPSFSSGYSCFILRCVS